MGPEDLQHQVAQIQTLLTERLKVRGRSLEEQLSSAGRLLPKHIRTEARFLVQAQALSRNPKLARMVDARRATRAHGKVVAYLRGIDPAARRNERILNTAALWSLYLFIAVGAVLTFAWWQGLI